MLFKTEMKLAVQFYDLDPMNVVWHGNYLKYLESARCDLLKKIGYDYDNMRADGVVYPIAKMDLKYIKPCKFNQVLFLETIVEELDPALIIKYNIFDEESGEKVFSAKSMQICVDIKTGESIYSAPEGLKQKLACCKL